MMTRRTRIGVWVLLGCFANAAMAHHGAFEYDMSKVQRFEGVIVKYVWRNPHNLIVLETRSESGEPLRLEIEGGGPSGLRPLGISADSFVVGERVTAVVSPSRRFPNQSAYGREIIRADGSIVPLDRRSADAEALQSSESALEIFGTWTAPWEGFMQLVGGRATWMFTEEGRNAFENYSPIMSSQAQCIPVSAPWLMVHPVVHEIEQSGELIVIRSDWMGAERTFYLDGRKHPPITERFQQGHSVGHWEDGMLIVDTTNFIDRIYAGLASSVHKNLVERFFLSEDGKSLNYNFVLNDPEFLAEPVSGTYQWYFRPDLEPSGIECDLDIAKRYLQELR